MYTNKSRPRLNPFLYLPKSLQDRVEVLCKNNLRPDGSPRSYGDMFTDLICYAAERSYKMSYLVPSAGDLQNKPDFDPMDFLPPVTHMRFVETRRVGAKALGKPRSVPEQAYDMVTLAVDELEKKGGVVPSTFPGELKVYPGRLVEVSEFVGFLLPVMDPDPSEWFGISALFAQYQAWCASNKRKYEPIEKMEAAVKARFQHQYCKYREETVVRAGVPHFKRRMDNIKKIVEYYEQRNIWLDTKVFDCVAPSVAGMKPIEA